jgi:hypothetical protein
MLFPLTSLGISRLGAGRPRNSRRNIPRQFQRERALGCLFLVPQWLMTQPRSWAVMLKIYSITLFGLI